MATAERAVRPGIRKKHVYSTAHVSTLLTGPTELAWPQVPILYIQRPALYQDRMLVLQYVAKNVRLGNGDLKRVYFCSYKFEGVHVLIAVFPCTYPIPSPLTFKSSEITNVKPCLAAHIKADSFSTPPTAHERAPCRQGNGHQTKAKP